MKNVDELALCRCAARLRLPRRQGRQGQTLVEYALILAIISVVAIGVMINMGQQVKTIYSNITSNVAFAASSH